MKAFLQGNRANNRQRFNLPSVVAESTMASAFHVLQLTQNAFLAHSSPQVSAASKRVGETHREMVEGNSIVRGIFGDFIAFSLFQQFCFDGFIEWLWT